MPHKPLDGAHTCITPTKDRLKAWVNQRISTFEMRGSSIVKPDGFNQTSNQTSSEGVLSSMAISLNSLESKTSPHSWHSTNSTSSSRATTRTRGCVQAGFIAVLSGICFAVAEVLIVLIFVLKTPWARLGTNFGYFMRERALVKGFSAIFRAFRFGEGCLFHL
jgi:hypothetical protein